MGTFGNDSKRVLLGRESFSHKPLSNFAKFAHNILASNMTSKMLTAVERAITKLVTMRLLSDRSGLAAALRRNKLKEYLEFELEHAGCDEDGLTAAFANKEFTDKLTIDELKRISGIEDEHNFINSFALWLDEKVFEPLYEREFGETYDKQMHQTLYQIVGIKSVSGNFSIRFILKFFKVNFFVLSCFCFIVSLILLKNKAFNFAFLNTIIVHDMFKFSINSYHKTYLLKGGIMIKQRVGLNSLLRIGKDMLGKDAERVNYLKYASIDVLLHNTIIGSLRKLFVDTNGNYVGKVIVTNASVSSSSSSSRGIENKNTAPMPIPNTVHFQKAETNKKID
jgi:hypothetical protein